MGIGGARTNCHELTVIVELADGHVLLDGGHVHGGAEGDHHEQGQQLGYLGPDGVPVNVTGHAVQLVDVPERLLGLFCLHFGKAILRQSQGGTKSGGTS